MALILGHIGVNMAFATLRFNRPWFSGTVSKKFGPSFAYVGCHALTPI